MDDTKFKSISGKYKLEFNSLSITSIIYLNNVDFSECIIFICSLQHMTKQEVAVNREFKNTGLANVLISLLGGLEVMLRLY